MSARIRVKPTARILSAAQRLFLQTPVSVILSALAAAGMLAVVSRIAVAHNSATQLWTILQQTWVLVLILTVPYLLARVYVWHELLEQLGIRVSGRVTAVSFAGGEITKSLPPASTFKTTCWPACSTSAGTLSSVRQPPPPPCSDSRPWWRYRSL